MTAAEIAIARIEDALIALYSHEREGTYAMVVAELCDKYLDRSGALLGRVRDGAMARNREGGAHE